MTRENVPVESCPHFPQNHHKDKVGVVQWQARDDEYLYLRFNNDLKTPVKVLNGCFSQLVHTYFGSAEEHDTESSASDSISQHYKLVSSSESEFMSKVDGFSPAGSSSAASSRFSVPNLSKWGEIPLDLASKIADNLELCENFQNFGQVCKSWRLGKENSKPPSRHIPWLMLAEPRRTSKRQFFNIFTQETRHVNLPVPHQFHIDYPEGEFAKLPPNGPERDEMSDWRYFSTKGWLVCVTQLGFNITLMNPWSGELIQVPRVPENWTPYEEEGKCVWDEDYYLTLFSKWALLESPSNNNDFILAMSFPMHQSVSIWRRGDNRWTVSSYKFAVDILFYKGKLYALDNLGSVSVFEIGANEGEPISAIKVAQLKLTQLKTWAEVPFDFTGNGYLVESYGKLLVVHRELLYGGEEEFKTIYFEVWEVNFEIGEFNKVDNLGNVAIFVGYNSSFSLEALPGYGWKPNCIYYTDCVAECYGDSPRGGGTDMGVFDLSLGEKIEELYDGPSRFSNVTPPIWVGG